MNLSMVRKFTEVVFDLYVVQGISLKEVLGIMKGSSDRKLKATANYLISELEKGCLLSEALFHCEIIRFDGVYVMFIKFAEKTGDLKSVFTFLKKRCDRKRQNFQRTLEAAVYPVFVIIVALVFLILFLIFGKSLYGNFEIRDSKVMGRFCKELFLVLMFCGMLFYVFWKNMGENKLYEAFLGMGFLTKAGVNVALAVGYGMLMVGPDSRYGRVFAEAQKRLEYGMDLKNSFGFTDGGRRIFAGRVDKELAEAFHFAQQTGKKSDVFEKIAENMNFVDERKRKICLCLVEPMFIAVTGIFLLILITNFLLPILSNSILI